MHSTTPAPRWLPNFRRAVKYLWPHRRSLFIGLFAALGVGVFYTFSISSVVPLLKVMFADNETLADWLNRVETERRLDVALSQDVPDDERGLLVQHVRAEARSGTTLKPGTRIVAIDGKPLSAYACMQFMATVPEKRLERVTLEYEGQTDEVQLTLRAYHGWSEMFRWLARLLPPGKDADARLRTLAVVMGVLVLITIFGGLCRVANEGLVALAVQRAMHDLRSRLADHVFRLPLAWHTAQPPGDTLGRFATDLSKVEVGISTLFGKTIREPIKAIGVLALTLFIDWRLLAVALLGLPIGVIVMRFFGQQVKRAQKRASHSWGRLLDHLGEKLAGIRVVKAYGMQEHEGRRFEAEGRHLTRAQTHIELVDAATNPALEVLAVISISAFVLYGASRVFGQELEPHLFFAAVVCLGGVFDPVRKMGNVNNRVQASEASGRRLFELMDLPLEEPPRATASRPLPRLRDQIEFQQLTFAYPSHPERSVVDHVNLTIPRGQCVALVGSNGSGKTTLMSLLLRFYTPTGGRILIDGIDLQDVSLDSLRAQIGLVTQDSVVFSGTVRSNIAYGVDEQVSDEQVRDAARLAHVDDFIQSLRVTNDGVTTTGYDALITSRTLSGGQRQRLAIARAILRDPPILVLDEATSQVDAESERKIQEALEDVTRGRTTFIIAHRFSTIARADTIVVLDHGRLIAHGRHAELLETCPFYVTLCRTQFAAGVVSATAESWPDPARVIPAGIGGQR